VRNISFDATEDDIRALFSEAGEINSVKFLNGKAFVRFTTPEGRKSALEFNGKQLNGRYLKVDLPLNLNNNPRPYFKKSKKDKPYYDSGFSVYVGNSPFAA
jgi:RNA recognition motif-containing protein